MAQLIAVAYASSPAEDLFGDLGVEICKQQRYVDGDVLLTVFDLLRTGDMAKGFAKLRNSFQGDAAKLAFQLRHGDPRKDSGYVMRVAKDFASGFLGAKYGIAPNYADATKFGEALGKRFLDFASNPELSQRQHSRRTTTEAGLFGSPITTTHTLTVENAKWPAGIVEDYMKEIRDLKRWGLYPNTRTLLDAVPYSFVVDWAINLGSTFKQVDMHFDRQYFPVDHVVSSLKRVLSLSSEVLWPGYPASGVVEFSYYSRFCASEVPLPQVSVGWGDGPWQHWTEAGALVVQRTR
jgi:hypothetical protein